MTLTVAVLGKAQPPDGTDARRAVNLRLCRNEDDEFIAAVAVAGAEARERLPDYARVHRWFVPEQPLSTCGLLTTNGRPRRERILQTFATRILQLAQGEPA